MMRGFLIGALSACAFAVAGAYLYVAMGWMPANADAKPGKLETWAARKSLRATLRREAGSQPDPLPVNEENLAAGIRLYAANCLVCHGASDGRPSNIAKGLYQRAPQLARHGVEDDPEARTYWMIEHGVRLTGMPSYKDSLTPDEIWKICMFLKNMDSLPPEAKLAWERIPSPAGASSGKETGGKKDTH